MFRSQRHLQQSRVSLEEPRQNGRVAFQIDTQTLDAAGVLVAAASDRGCVRELNEDYLGVYTSPPDVSPDLGVLAVLADGMGGHAAGEIASKLAVSAIAAAFYQTDGQRDADTAGDSFTEAVHHLYAGFMAANHAIRQASQHSPDQEGMGCTCIAAALSGDEITLAHVGDTRAYLIQPAVDSSGKHQRSLSAIRQLTADHSFAAELVRAGCLLRTSASLSTPSCGHASVGRSS
jgi:serine/threonine protein phosphatase PrpC